MCVCVCGVCEFPLIQTALNHYIKKERKKIHDLIEIYAFKWIVNVFDYYTPFNSPDQKDNKLFFKG